MIVGFRSLRSVWEPSTLVSLLIEDSIFILEFSSFIEMVTLRSLQSDLEDPTRSLTTLDGSKTVEVLIWNGISYLQLQSLCFILQKQRVTHVNQST